MKGAVELKLDYNTTFGLEQCKCVNGRQVPLKCEKLQIVWKSARNNAKVCLFYAALAGLNDLYIALVSHTGNCELFLYVSLSFCLWLYIVIDSMYLSKYVIWKLDFQQIGLDSM